jgi:hypothetical protein
VSCKVSYWRWDYGQTPPQIDAGNVPTVSHDFNQQNATFFVTLTVTNPAGTISVIQTVTTQ